ncbi:heterokaryon incompatibility protein-domain-containing protein [Alternaria rosae]|uniref:heterokaryon incompatibility protein-domain-containing protein n=1 Tax=Alternaria rosae TaxID=1187941 RepID=UPI001E8D7FBA|nr:heterokaryon incompatibility protein-domain-containing protein [Alternaria rosae]KAH6870445.1 heterokaryon incompatibility protein-domain-containing protein [Alternaria rosae]
MADDPAAAPYHYLPIPPTSKCIRVLDVDAASTEAAAVVGLLRIVDLETSPDFTAISYVWGSPKDNRIITCSGVDIVVSVNGYSALQHLRARLGAFTIWIDAVCIDQKNTKEKEHQIPLMGDIYSQAATVYVWLGEGNEKSDRAIKYMETAGFLDYFQAESGDTKTPKADYGRPFLAACSATIARWSLIRHPFVFHDSVGTWRGPLSPIILRLCSRDAKYATEDDLLDLLQRDWISRLWTYQEILLASNPVIVCGSTHICWNRFAISLIFLATASPRLGSYMCPWKRVAMSRQDINPDCVNSDPASDSSLEGYAEFSRRMCRLHRLTDRISFCFLGFLLAFLLWSAFLGSNPHERKVIFAVSLTAVFIILVMMVRLVLLSSPRVLYRNEERQTNVNDLIDGVYTRDATVSKDMAFGLWAILQRRTRHPLPRVDYGESKEAIYLSFSRLLVQITGSPHLVLIAAMNNMKGQPSWVPDWTPNEHRENKWGDIERLIRSNHVTRGDKSSCPFGISKHCDLGDVDRTRVLAAPGEVADDTDRGNLGNIRISMVGDHAISIHGRRQGVVVATFNFYKTQSSYQQAEYRKHIHNLGRLLQILETTNMNLPFYGHIGTFAQFDCWERFICRHRRKEVSALFSLLRDGSRWGTSKATDHNLLSTHIAVCNALADDSTILFQGSNPGPLGRPSIGECRRNVKPGDLIIRCPGVEIPIIVRPCFDGRNGVQIKSIAFSPQWSNQTKLRERLRHVLSRTLQPHGSVQSELEEFHVY